MTYPMKGISRLTTKEIGRLTIRAARLGRRDWDGVIGGRETGRLADCDRNLVSRNCFLQALLFLDILLHNFAFLQDPDLQQIQGHFCKLQLFFPGRNVSASVIGIWFPEIVSCKPFYFWTYCSITLLFCRTLIYSRYKDTSANCSFFFQVEMFLHL